jgi:DNA gyrase/topoisomerase IV subunit A
MATMVMSACCLIDSVGNWGTLIDPPAAARYTEAVLSRYGDTFFGRDYLAVTEMVPNYDKKDKEPLCLPALLPNPRRCSLPTAK